MIDSSLSDKSLPYFNRVSSKSYTQAPTGKPTKKELHLSTSSRMIQSVQVKKDENSEGKSPQHKRQRLRDYLFMANVCSTRNKEKKKEINRTFQDLSAARQSRAQLRQHKYEIPNEEMHKIISEELVREFQDVIVGLSEAKEEIKTTQHRGSTKEDLTYLYQVRRIVQNKLQTAVKEIRDLQIMKQNKVVKEIFDMNQEGGAILSSSINSMTLGQPQVPPPPDSDKLFSIFLPSSPKND